jgi:hypothetical protein
MMRKKAFSLIIAVFMCMMMFAGSYTSAYSTTSTIGTTTKTSTASKTGTTSSAPQGTPPAGAPPSGYPGGIPTAVFALQWKNPHFSDILKKEVTCMVKILICDDESRLRYPWLEFKQTWL